MPFYEYECAACGHTLEVLQKISDAPLTECPNCQRQTLNKLISRAGFKLTGTGWYETDFKNSGNKAGGKSATGTASSQSAEQGGDQSKDQSKDQSSGSSNAGAGQSASEAAATSARSGSGSAGSGDAKPAAG